MSATSATGAAGPRIEPGVTGDDHMPSHDIGLSEDGSPRWFTRLDPSDDRE